MLTKYVAAYSVMVVTMVVEVVRVNVILRLLEQWWVIHGNFVAIGALRVTVPVIIVRVVYYLPSAVLILLLVIFHLFYVHSRVFYSIPVKRVAALVHCNLPILLVPDDQNHLDIAPLRQLDGLLNQIPTALALRIDQLLVIRHFVHLQLPVELHFFLYLYLSIFFIFQTQNCVFVYNNNFMAMIFDIF